MQHLITSFFELEAQYEGNGIAGSGVVVAIVLTDTKTRIVIDGRSDYAAGFYMNDPSAPWPAVELFIGSADLDRLYRGETTMTELLLKGEAAFCGRALELVRLLPGWRNRGTRYRAYCERA